MYVAAGTPVLGFWALITSILTYCAYYAGRSRQSIHIGHASWHESDEVGVTSEVTVTR